MSKFDETKFKITGTYTSENKFTYQAKMNTAPRGVTSGSTFKNTVEYKISNIDRKLVLKFTHNSAIVTVRSQKGDGTYEDSTSGYPLFVGDKIFEISDITTQGSEIGTIASITSGTEGVNVTAFNLVTYVSLNQGSGTIDSLVDYKAQYSSAIDLSTIASSSNTHTSVKLFGLSFYYEDGATVQTWPAHLNIAGSSYYEVFSFTAYAQKSFIADKLGKLIKNGIYSIIGWNKVSNTIKILKDVYNDNDSKTVTTEQNISLGKFNITDSLTFDNRGDDVYIGTGKNSNPLFYGHPNVIQFGKKSSNVPILTDGPTLVNKSVIPKFEQFIVPPNSDASADDWYLNEITESSWNITNDAQTIIGYEKDSPFLLKATKGKGVSNTFFAQGNIMAIRHNNRDANTVWVLSNAQTHYLLILVDTYTMTIDSNRIYRITSATGEQYIPSASSNEVLLTDVLYQFVGSDKRLYIQASDKDIDSKELSESVFGNDIPNKQAYVWRSANINIAPTSVPDIGWTDLEFTNITPTMSPSVKTVLISPVENEERTPYWYYYESGTQTTEGERPGDQDQTKNIIQKDGFSTSDNLLTGEEFALLQAPAKRGLVDYSLGHKAIGVVIPYTENSVTTNSIIKASGELQEYEESDGGDRSLISVQGYKIGPIVTQSISIPNINDSNNHQTLRDLNVLLGAHIQIINNAPNAISGRESNPTPVKRMALSVSTDEMALLNILDNISNDGSIIIYGDGAQFTEFNSISTIISGNEYPLGLAVTEGSRVHTWHMWQNSDFDSGNYITFGTAVGAQKISGSQWSVTLATNASSINDVYNNKYIVFTGGKGGGSQAKITDYAGSTKKAYFNASIGEAYDNTSVYYIIDSPRKDQSDNIIQEGHWYASRFDKTIPFNLSNLTIPHKTFTPSNALGNQEIETVPPAMLASQSIPFDEQSYSTDNAVEGVAHVTAVIYPNDEFNLYYKHKLFTEISNVTWNYLNTLSTIKITVTDSTLSIKDNSQLLPDKEEGGDSHYKSKFYRISLMYDGYQESRLSKTIYSSPTNPHAEGQNIEVKVLPNKLNPRISHINIYRGTALEDSAIQADSSYNLVKSIPFNGDGWIETTDGYLSFDIEDNKGDNFGSYEALTGISSEMNSNWLNYSLSEQCAGYLFVAKANNAEISNTDNYVFRSKAGKYNIFNWANEYCAIPESVTCLKSYNNFLYAFSTSSVYTINPNNLSIIDKMEGQGVLSDEGVVATDYGMFFADKYGVYIHNGKSAQLISRAIEDTDNTDLSNYVWSNVNWELNPPKLAFDSQRKSLLIFFTYNNNSYAWVYSVLQKRWDLWSFDNEVKAVIQGKFGEIIASDGKLFQVGTGTTRKAWEFQSKKITAGFDTYEKQFKEVHYEGTSSVDTTYKTSLADSSWNALSSNRLNSAHSKSKWLQIRAKDTTGDKQLESLGVHFRPLRAKSTKV